MQNRLVIIVALALLGASLTAGAVSADSSSSVLGVGEAGVSIDLPDGGELPAVGGSLPDCSNGEDDDDDGLLDLEDPGCEGPLDPSEKKKNPENPAGGSIQPDQPTSDTGKTGEVTDPGKDGGGPKNPPNDDNPFDKDKSGKKGGKQGDRGGGEKKKGKDRGKDSGKGGDQPPEIRKPDGRPTNSNPAVSVAPFGPAPVGVPNFIIDQFTIPPFLLPIYQACGTEYGIPWQVLASINRIETAFGTNLNVSTAGAVGWMQFLPSTWKAYGVDANRDGRKDPYNPVDAICGAARYLHAAGGSTDLRRAIFSYNHADWYVDEVLLYARQYGKLPSSLVGSLTGLTEGAHFPVAAKARYADDISERAAERRAKPRKGSAGNVADVISDSPTRRGINIFAKQGSPVVAVNDGVIKKIGRSKRLGRHIILEDAYGNEFTYAQLGKVSDVIPVPKNRKLGAADFKLVTPGKGGRDGAGRGKRAASSGPADTEDARERLFALPERKNNRARADLNGQLDDLLAGEGGRYETVQSYFTGTLKFNPKTMETRPLRKGSKVVAGTVLARVGSGDELAPHVNFAIEPAGRGSRKIDPKPILDGWKLLEATAIYRATGKDPFNRHASVGQILLMSKGQLQRTVLRDPRMEIYSCGREDIRTGQIDRRVLATLAYLTERGFRPTVTSLKCGHSIYTTSGNVSHHSSGNAVDIARVNGIPILGHQGPGSVTEAVINELLKLQGTMAPAQIISLMEMGGPTFAMGDHADHIHVGFTPAFGPGERNTRPASLLDPNQWDKLLDRIGELDQPEVPIEPSRFSLPSKRGAKGKRGSRAHIGE
jgi:hypothetical protein